MRIRAVDALTEPMKHGFLPTTTRKNEVKGDSHAIVFQVHAPDVSRPEEAAIRSEDHVAGRKPSVFPTREGIQRRELPRAPFVAGGESSKTVPQ